MQIWGRNDEFKNWDKVVGGTTGWTIRPTDIEKNMNLRDIHVGISRRDQHELAHVVEFGEKGEEGGFFNVR